MVCPSRNFKTAHLGELKKPEIGMCTAVTKVMGGNTSHVPCAETEKGTPF